ncbi:GNAT family N-acetyltransferase [Rhodococcoides corynebacterioides]|uniref:GNAT family N-acetyltransferase n=1 Tax=Rhodococcoides corynebacterioides TaxID=53972 RepID=UPI001C9AFCEA|nr:GNAT family N-acetyltransferase [Rhodococcus corynebacterioides]MBY6362661.1 GNAT family N-acetyltransferase [Rhodococcus corynebacterioides]
MVEIRLLRTPDELLASQQVFRAAMVGLPGLPVTREVVTTLREPGLTYGAYDESTLVGTTDAGIGTLTLPGGAAVSHLAVTHVGVLPTHTRRGIVSALLRRQLRDARDAGHVVATLRASEAVIYGRYGYGVATSSLRAEVITARARLRDGVTISGTTRLIDRDGALDRQAAIVDENPSARPGFVSRLPIWWAAHRLRENDEPVWIAVHSTDGRDDGYVRYRPADPSQWWSGADRRVVVDDLHAPTDAVFADLLRFLLRLDLVDRITFPALPVDTVLPLLVHDRRSVRLQSTSDETWLRILDVDAALAARTYGAGPSVTITVDDDDLPENAGTVEVGPDGVHRVDGPGALRVHVRDLAAVLLGGTSWRSLAVAGLVTGDAAATAAADTLFATELAPFAGVGF